MKLKNRSENGEHSIVLPWRSAPFGNVKFFLGMLDRLAVSDVPQQITLKSNALAGQNFKLEYIMPVASAGHHLHHPTKD